MFTNGVRPTITLSILTLALGCGGSVNIALAQAERNKLLAYDGAADDYFGRASAISGDVLVVGADHDDDNGTDSGSAYVYRWQDDQWSLEAKLLPTDGEANNRFAWATAIDGDTIVFGVHHDNDKGIDSGSAYIFHFNGTNWAQQAKLVADDGIPAGYFGRAVAIHRDLAVIGSKGQDSQGSASGAAYVFRRSGSTWTQEAKLLASDGQAYDVFGWSVAVSDDVILVGVKGDDDNGTDAGAAYIFRYEDGQWREKQKLLADDGAPGDSFGAAAAISQDVAVVGATLNDNFAPDAGAAYVFRFNGSSWVQERKLLPHNGEAGDQFGWSVGVSGDTAIIGANLNDELASDAGAAYVFVYDGVNWLQRAKLTADDAAAGDDFGVSVGFSDGRAVVGVMYDDENGPDSGSVRVFSDVWRCLGDLDYDGYRNVTDFTHFAAAYGSQLRGNGYNPSADLNGDGFVNVTDFTLFANNFGHACP
jgi:hypothetical protein